MPDFYPFHLNALPAKCLNLQDVKNNVCTSEKYMGKAVFLKRAIGKREAEMGVMTKAIE